MADETKQEDELSIYLANEIVTLANAKLDAGLSQHSIASALRHAAANFGAFVSAQNESGQDPKDMQIQDFANLFEHYLSLHRENSDNLEDI